ncbi:polyribonucleotide nucleotidyltransferase [Pelobium sp.]|nr:polyribonucleotide nucleotidyltransferase [Pelobium sp.]MDA9555799.1 polyribonucleotide nucleotidyltransferase [Pelobium sp.]
MSLNVFKQSIDLGDGRIIEIETGKLAKQADGAVVVKMGDTMLLATVVSNKDAKEGVDFLPLSVDYQEKYAAAGRIPGGFLRREARLSDYEVLISRLVDRALRPLFPEDYHADTQVMISLISSDKNIMPDALAGLAASAALAVSDIPFNGPISEVRVAKIDGQLVINPSRSDLERATLEFIVAGSAKDINMVEGEADEIQEAELVEAIQFAHEAIKKQVAAQEELTKLVGKTEKRTYSHENSNLELKAQITADTYDKVYAVAKSGAGKDERAAAFKAIQDDVLASLGEDASETTKFLAKKYFHDVQYDAVRALLLNEGIRLDGRNTKQIRPIWSEVGYLPSAHGSAIFTRGETQSLTTVTLGAKDDEQLIDGAFINGYNKFLLHYNFPSFSTGEARPNRGVGRREIGHGNLAMRALKKVLPADSENPYTIRVVSDILESNGSSSMATVCAGTLALMDAGIKITAPVSGIAMGLISDDQTGKYANKETLNQFNVEDRYLYDLLSSMGYNQDFITNNIYVDRLEISDFISVKFTSENPELSAFVVNNICSEFISYYTTILKENQTKSVKFLSKLAQIKNDTLNKQVAALRKYKIDNRIINLAEQSRKMYELTADYETKKQTAEKDIIALKGAIDNIDSQFDPSQRKYIEASLTKINQEIMQSKNQLSALSELQIKNEFDPKYNKAIDSLKEVISEKILDASDKYINNPLNAKQNLIAQKLSLQVQYDIARYSLNSLKKELQEMNTKFDKLVPHEAVIQSLERKIDVASKEYLDILDRYNNASLESSLSTKLRQAQSAMPGVQLPSKKMLLIILSGIIIFYRLIA